MLDEGVHALFVIGLGIDGINTDRVGIQFRDIRDITLAAIGVGQRILEVVAGRLRARVLLYQGSAYVTQSSSILGWAPITYADKRHHGCNY